jgi:Tfp pilus assembly protein PilF
MDREHHAAPEPEAYELFQRGTRFLREGHPAQAAMLLERAARLAPGKNSIREALARSYFQLGRHDQAAQVFRDITEAAPTNDYAHFGLACSLVNLGRLHEACRHFRVAVAMRPDHAVYRLRLARCELRLRREAPTGADG